MSPLVSRDLDSTPALFAGAMPAPEVGAPAVIVPVRLDEPVAGEVTLWSPGLGGIVVTCRVRVDAQAVELLAGERVWVRMRAPEAMVVVQAAVHPVQGRPDEMELVGVTGLAVEVRRGAVRARLERPVTLVRGTSRHTTSTLDLSATGCRVRLPEDDGPLRPGEQLSVHVSDATGDELQLRSEVIRVDLDSGEAALRFVDIAPAVQNRLDREVLAWHAARVRH